MLRAAIDRLLGRKPKPVLMRRVVESVASSELPPLSILPFRYEVQDGDGKFWIMNCTLVDPGLTLMDAKDHAWGGEVPDDQISFVVANYSHRVADRRAQSYVRFQIHATPPSGHITGQSRRQVHRSMVYQIMWDLGQLLLDLGYREAVVPRADLITGKGRFDCSVMPRVIRPMTTRVCNHD